MKKHTKEIIGLVVLIIQIIFGVGLVIIGTFYKPSSITMTIGAFLLMGSGRKEISEIFSLFKKG